MKLLNTIGYILERHRERLYFWREARRAKRAR